MKITASKETVNVENVKPMEPQIVRILDSKGMEVAFVCIGYKATSINIGICQEDNFKLEVAKELVWANDYMSLLLLVFVLRWS